MTHPITLTVVINCPINMFCSYVSFLAVLTSVKILSIVYEGVLLLLGCYRQ